MVRRLIWVSRALVLDVASAYESAHDGRRFSSGCRLLISPLTLCAHGDVKRQQRSSRRVSKLVRSVDRMGGIHHVPLKYSKTCPLRCYWLPRAISHLNPYSTFSRPRPATSCYRPTRQCANTARTAHQLILFRQTFCLCPDQHVCQHASVMPARQATCLSTKSELSVREQIVGSGLARHNIPCRP
jgi:hypothetical protein